MSDLKINALSSIPLLFSPLALSAALPPQETISAPRASARFMQYQLAASPRLQPMGMPVGELQERWQFPSDHLPIGMTLDDLDFVSWNVLDAAYMSWVTEKNSQGLSRSMIADEHVRIEKSKLTIRDRHIVDLILQMIAQPRSFLCLQECGEPFIKELRSRLPAHFTLITHHGEGFLFDNSRFECIEAKEVSGVFKDDPKRTLQDISLRRLDNGKTLRIVNGHLPGDPTKPGPLHFAEYLANTFDPAITTLAMGDMNFNELEMDDAMQQAFVHRSPFAMYSPYCTNIAPVVFESKAIDHFFIYTPDPASIAINAPEQILPGLEEVVKLLQ